MKQPKYAARFLNFFLNLRLNRAEFADMAAFTLVALRANPKYKALADALETELKAYRAIHAGQLSGEGQGATLTLKQALTDLKEYVRMVERKYIIPNYADGSPDYVALLPNGRSALVNSNQSKIEDNLTAFFDAMDARPEVFPQAVRAAGRNLKDPKAVTILSNVQATLAVADKAKNDSGNRKIDLHDGRKATCGVLFQAYATLLLEFWDNPKKAAPFFDLSKARVNKSGGQPPKDLKPE